MNIKELDDVAKSLVDLLDTVSEMSMITIGVELYNGLKMHNYIQLNPIQLLGLPSTVQQCETLGKTHMVHVSENLPPWGFKLGYVL